MAWSEWKNVSSDISIWVQYLQGAAGGNTNNGYDAKWQTYLYPNKNYDMLSLNLSGTVSYWNGAYACTSPLWRIVGITDNDQEVSIYAGFSSVLNASYSISNYKTIKCSVALIESSFVGTLEQIRDSVLSGTIGLS